MTLIGSIVVGVSANTEKLQKGLQQGGSALAKFGSSLSGAAVAGPAAFAAGLATIGGAAVSAFGGFLAMTSKAADAIDELGAMAQQFGIGAGAMRDFQATAALSDTSLETVGKGLKKMESEIVKAARSAKSDNPFNTIGLSARELSAMAPEAAFEQVAKAIADLPGPMERVAAAQAIFGKGGSELIPMLMELAGGSDSLREKMGLLGAQFSESGVQGVKSAKDAWDGFKQSLSFVFEVAAIKLAPAMQLLIEKFQGFLQSKSGQDEILTFFEMASMGVLQLVDAIDWLVQGFGLAAAEASHLKATYEGLLAINPFSSDEEKAQHRQAALEAQTQAYRTGAAAQRGYADGVAGNEKRLAQILDENRAKAQQLADERKNAGEIEPTEKTKVKSSHGDRLAKFMGEGAKLFEDSLTPAEKYERQIKKLHGLWSLGAISQTTWARSMGKARKEFDDETAKGTKKQRDEADKLKEAVKTPLEEYQDEVARVRKLREGGFIDDQTAKRGIDKAGRDLFDKGNKADKQNTELAALEFGSKEAFSAILNSNKPMERMAQLAELQLEALRQLVAGQGSGGDSDEFDQV